jgi:thiaminase (transcriptional activator TenA)
MSGRFSGELWDGVTDIYAAILAHPFLAGMTDGSLPADAFTFYVIQDALYLRRYIQALAAVASHAPNPAQTEMFARNAAEIVAVEMSLHEALLADMDIDPAAVDAAEEAPTTLAYSSYLLASTQGGSYAESVGTVLPCYWIYGDVGKLLLGRGSPNPRYQRWIDTYGGEQFDAEVRDVMAVADTLGPELSPAERQRVHRQFRTTSRYEWMFWDMAYRKEAWPI